jgi:AcrR family transcriptional regulator
MTARPDGGDGVDGVDEASRPAPELLPAPELPPHTGARRRPARRGEGSALRDEIIEAATREIARTGDAGALTLRGVAREVGVAATSIYLHFDSVEKLLDEVKLARFDQFTSALRDAVDAVGADPRARMLARARAYVTFWREHPGEYAVMFAARMHPTAGGYPRAMRVADALDDLAVDVAGVWAEPVDADRPPSAQAMMCAVHLWTGLHGMLSLRMVRPHMPWPDLDAQVADLVERLISSGS